MSLTHSSCPVFGVCGGCQHHDIPYPEELTLKEEAVRAALAELSLPPDSVRPLIASPKVLHYRNRIDLKLLKRRDGNIHIGFSPVERGPVVEIEGCPIAMEAISSAIPKIRTEAPAKLPPEYKMANLVIRCGDGSEVRWGGIGKRSTRLSDTEYLYTDLSGQRIYYSLDTFFQANLSILPLVREEIRQLGVWGPDVSFFDLYGGVGLFSLMVSDLVAKVVLIEENTHSIRLARWNMMQNRVGNMAIFEGRVEAILGDLLAKATTAQHVLMVDPPRAGLSQDSVTLLNNLPSESQLVYLSCAPESLARDLKDLVSGGWEVRMVRPFDFFPRTRHVETLVHLARRTG